MWLKVGHCWESFEVTSFRHLTACWQARWSPSFLQILWEIRWGRKQEYSLVALFFALVSFHFLEPERAGETAYLLWCFHPLAVPTHTLCSRATFVFLFLYYKGNSVFSTQVLFCFKGFQCLSHQILVVLLHHFLISVLNFGCLENCQANKLLFG